MIPQTQSRVHHARCALRAAMVPVQSSTVRHTPSEHGRGACRRRPASAGSETRTEAALAAIKGGVARDRRPCHGAGTVL